MQNYECPWLYNDEPLLEAPEGFLGFVYLITELNTGRKYIGKKLFKKTITRPPLKGQKRKRKSIVDSDWRTYCSSSDELKGNIQKYGLQNYKREVLQLCTTKGLLSYYEAKMQFDLGVLFDDNFMNGIIQVRINRSHVRSKSK